MVEKNMFSGSFMDMLDSNDPLIALADNFPWSKIEFELSQYYTGIGRPPKSIRLMAGLLLLKQLENLSDENVVLQWKRNPYYQYFCGFDEYTPALPCHSTELTKFRDRIGKDGFEFIFKMSVEMHGDASEESQVVIDSTVQESNMTFPTDGKLAIKIILKLLKIAKKEKIKLRRSFIKELKKLRIQLRFFRHPKKIKTAMGAMKRLRAIAMIILRDINRKFEDNMQLHTKYAEDFYLFNRILKQEKNTPNKIYSLHELDAYAINKGKDHKGYEFGTKASIATTMNSGIIVGVAAHKTNIGDVNTLDEVIANIHKNRETPVEEAVCDRGYRGRKIVSNNRDSLNLVIYMIIIILISIRKNIEYSILSILLNTIQLAYTTQISIPGTVLKRDTKKQLEEKRIKFRRRAAIEPVIGHLKSDHRMARNYLKGFKGDEINLLLAASAFNLKKWMNIYFYGLFIQNSTLIFIAIKQINTIKSQIFRLLLTKVY
jgi:IS5 family transposase